ncbi:MAG: 3-dehydroquinate synthase [Clostridiales bacterium]|nr:3-dehydroquinate synthase [Clostridiales bacterium]
MELVSFKVKTNRPYGVVMADGATEFLPTVIDGCQKVVIVSDETVYPIFGKGIKKLLEEQGVKVYNFIYPSGESGKGKFVIDKLLILFTELNILKTDCVIALGGGIACDITGCACAMFKGGIPYVNIPTTLSAMAGACIGGDCSVNFLGRKNLLGVHYQPSAVVIDTEFIKSLSEIQKADGMAEIIRIATGFDARLFKNLERGFDEEFSLEDALVTVLKIKARLVAKDELFEKNARKLSIGQTFSNATESLSGFNLNYGKAIAYGVLKAADMSEILGFATCIKGRIRAVFEKYNVLPADSELAEKLYPYVLADYKRQGDDVNFVLPTKIGKCKIMSIDKDKLKNIL